MKKTVPARLVEEALKYEENPLGVPDGDLSLAGLADLYLHYAGLPQESKAPYFWVWVCMNELQRQDPELSFECLRLCIEGLNTPIQAAFVAAGPLEDLIVYRGRQVIALIEEEAAASARFRYVLSGVWSQGIDETEIWQRVLRARQVGPHMDENGELPAD